VSWFQIGLGILVLGVGLVGAGAWLQRVPAADEGAAHDWRLPGLVLGVAGVGLMIIGMRLMMPA
jgi:hypothetical protein